MFLWPASFVGDLSSLNTQSMKVLRMPHNTKEPLVILGGAAVFCAAKNLLLNLLGQRLSRTLCDIKAHSFWLKSALDPFIR